MVDYFATELYELRGELVACKTGIELLNFCWNDSTKNWSAYSYISGMADALFWAGKITQEEYTNFLKGLNKK